MYHTQSHSTVHGVPQHTAVHEANEQHKRSRGQHSVQVLQRCGDGSKELCWLQRMSNTAQSSNKNNINHDQVIRTVVIEPSPGCLLHTSLPISAKNTNCGWSSFGLRCNALIIPTQKNIVVTTHYAGDQVVILTGRLHVCCAATVHTNVLQACE
jgi:hypothetical protein